MTDTKERPNPATHKEEPAPDSTCDQKATGVADAGREQQERNSRAGIIEKVFTLVSIVLLVSTVGLLLAETFQEDAPPAFSISVEPPARSGSLTAVSVLIHNTGDETAKALQVRAEVPVSEEERIDAEASLDWLPGGSKRRVTLLFPPETDLKKLKVTIVGYEVP